MVCVGNCMLFLRFVKQSLQTTWTKGKTPNIGIVKYFVIMLRGRSDDYQNDVAIAKVLKEQCCAAWKQKK